MSLIIQLPPSTEFYQPVAPFTAIFNAVTPGFYDWNSPANTGVPFQEMGKNNLYIIERYSFVADVGEEAFTQALNGGILPTLQVRIPKQQNRQIYPRPIPVSNFFDGLEVLISAFTSQDDFLSGTFRGRLAQPFALIGTNSITAFCQFNIYEVKNKVWIDNFLGRTKGGQAQSLVLPSGRTVRVC